MSESADRVRMAPSPFARDVMTSAATALLTMASLVLVTGWLAAALGPALFAVYALSRRILSAAGAVVPGPLGVALARALAATRGERERHAYLWAGTLLALGPTLGLIVAGAALAGFWADLLLSDRRHAPEFLAVLALIGSNAVYVITFARLRGVSEIRTANLWQLWTMAIGPVLIVGLMARRSTVATILLLLAAVSLTAAVPLVGWLIRGVREGLRAAEVRALVPELIRYTVPRIPGNASLAGLLSLGPLLAPHLGDLREAGYLVAAQSVLRMAEVGTAGLALVLLPRVSALRHGREVFLRDRVEDFVGMVLHLGLFATFHLALWAPEIVWTWLGPSYQEAVPIFRILLVALVPYLGYTLLRSVIDGMEDRPVNAHNLHKALACTVLLSLAAAALGWGAPGLAFATVAGFATLGGLTLVHLRRALGITGGHLRAGAAALLNLAAVVVAIGLRAVLAGRLDPPGLLAVGAGVSGVLLLAYLVVIRRLRVRWVLEIETRLLQSGGSR